MSTCPSCGGEIGPRAKFCRSCGAAVEATQATPRQPGSPPPPSPVPPPAEPRGSSGARGPMLALAAFAVCLLLGGLVGGGAYLLSRDGSEDESGLGGPIVDPPPPPGPGGGGQGGGPSDGSSEGEGGVETEGGESSGLIAGLYVQAGSFRSADGAESEAGRLAGYGVDAEVVPAAWTNELLPGFQVLLVGPLATSGEERRVLRALERANISGFGRDLTPSDSVAGPESVAGDWRGRFEQSDLRGARPPTTYVVELTLDREGEGTVEYPGRGCFGTLSLIDDDGFSLAYAETIGSGSCPGGNVWHVRPRGTGIVAVRLHEDLDMQAMVHGEAGSATG